MVEGMVEGMGEGIAEGINRDPMTITRSTRAREREDGSTTGSEDEMGNDKAFAMYAFTLVGAVLCLFATVVSLGIASVPSLGFIVEHAAIGLAIRTGYKSLDGGNPVVDFLHYTGWMSADEAGPPAGAIPSAA
jgi:hypothetical protein